MPGAGHPVQAMQVIRQRAVGEQPIAECGEDLRPVVDPGEQYGLIQYGDTGIAQARDGPAGGLIDLVRVIAVQHHHDLRGVGAQSPEQTAGNALRDDHGQARVNAQGDLRAPARDPFHDRGDLPVRQQQWIAAGKDQFAKRRLAQQPIDVIQALPRGNGVLAVGVVAPETIAAVDRAVSAHHQQGPAVVLAQHARRAGIVRHLAEGVSGEGRIRILFSARRKDLQQKGIARIAGAHARGKRPGDAQGKVPLGARREGQGGDGQAHGIG